MTRAGCEDGLWMVGMVGVVEVVAVVGVVEVGWSSFEF